MGRRRVPRPPGADVLLAAPVETSSCTWSPAPASTSASSRSTRACCSPRPHDTRDRARRALRRRGRDVRPAAHRRGQAAKFGANLWERHPDRCCEMRKVEPLERVLADADAWVTGIRRQQSVLAPRSAQGRARREARRRQGAAARRLDRRDGARLRARARHPDPPAARARLPVDRLLAVHPPGRPRRGRARRPLGRTRRRPSAACTSADALASVRGCVPDASPTGRGRGAREGLCVSAIAVPLMTGPAPRSGWPDRGVRIAIPPTSCRPSGCATARRTPRRGRAGRQRRAAAAGGARGRRPERRRGGGRALVRRHELGVGGLARADGGAGRPRRSRVRRRVRACAPCGPPPAVDPHARTGGGQGRAVSAAGGRELEHGYAGDEATLAFSLPRSAEVVFAVALRDGTQGAVEARRLAETVLDTREG